MLPNKNRGARTQSSVIFIMPRINDHQVRILFDDLLAQVPQGIRVNRRDAGIHHFDVPIGKGQGKSVFQEPGKRPVLIKWKANHGRGTLHENPESTIGLLFFKNKSDWLSE